MNTERIDHLLQQFASNSLSNEEAEELLILVEEDRDNLSERIAAILENDSKAIDTKSPHWQKMLNEIVSVDKYPEKSSDKQLFRFSISRWAAVAAILLLVSYSAWLFVKDTEDIKVESNKSVVKNITPGKDKAVLTLTDGSEVTLDEENHGHLVGKGSNHIGQIHDGLLEITGATNGDERILTVKTPRGGKYKVALSDGSIVWLNAESSIRFPAAFTTTERRVEITGEVYFEVAKKTTKSGAGNLIKKVPFIVKTPDQEVQVLGTHFNINAYADENAIRTTLLEGSVRVIATKGPQGVNSRLLRPGEQSLIQKSSSSISVDKVNPEAIIAWKNNMFQFDGVNINAVMRQIARWYDVEIEYETTIPEGHLTGYISRDVPIQKVLKMLHETSDVDFVVNGRTVTVKVSE